jgi:hypothetical protein
MTDSHGTIDVTMSPLDTSDLILKVDQEDLDAPFTRAQALALWTKANALHDDIAKRLDSLEGIASTIRKRIVAVVFAILTSIGGGVAIVWEYGGRAGDSAARLRSLEESHLRTLQEINALRMLLFENRYKGDLP